MNSFDVIVNKWLMTIHMIMYVIYE